MNKSTEESYRRHASHEAQQIVRGLPASFVRPDTLECWRHHRMLNIIEPFLKEMPDATWLTIGDGNFGMDAHYLQNRGLDVLASSLTDTTLKVAAENGFIEKFESVNAEQIQFDEDQFDYVLCKEAYHHFPRPAIAFYEMLRVAREALILIEPYDGSKRLLDVIKEPAKKILWGKDETIHFEPCGNYIYRINQKEIGKKLTAMGFSVLAYKTFNDIYIPKFGRSKCGSSLGYLLTCMAIKLQDLLCALRLLNPALIILFCFKKTPSPAQEKVLKSCGFRLIDLPLNPYV